MRSRQGASLLVSQVLSSAGSLAYLIIAAHGLPLAEYGLLGVSLACGLFLNGVLRSLTSDVYVPRAKSGRFVSWGSALGTSVFLSLVLSFAGALVVWAIARFSAFEAILVLVGFVSLSAYQVARSALFAAGRLHRVTMIEASWLVGAVTFSLLLIISNHDSAPSWLAVYGLTAALPCVLLTGLTRRWRLLLPSSTFIRGEWLLTRYYLLDFVLGSGIPQLMMLSLPLVMALDSVGEVRLAQSVLGPQGFLASSIGLVGIVLLSRTIRESPRRGCKLVVSGSVGAGTLILIYAVCLSVLPQTVVLTVFGPNASASGPVYWSIATAGFFIVATSGLVVFMRVHEAGKSLLLARLYVLPVASAPLIGGAMSGAAGAAIGLAILGASTFASTVLQVLTVLRKILPGPT